MISSVRWELIRGAVFEQFGVDLGSQNELERLAHKAAEIGFTYGALGRDFEYVYKNVDDMLREELGEPTT